MTRIGNGKIFHKLFINLQDKYKGKFIGDRIMKNHWKLRIVASSLIIMILLSSSSNLVSMTFSSVSPELLRNAQSKSAWQLPSVDEITMQTPPPQGDYVPILYTSMYGGQAGASFGLLFYSWIDNKFMVYWRLNDGGLVIDCLRAGGSANYFLWLNITDNNGDNILLEQETMSVEYYQGYNEYTPTKSNWQISWPLSIEMVGFVGGTYFQESKWKKFLFIEKLGVLAFTLWDIANLAEVIYLWPYTYYYLGVIGPWGVAAAFAWIAAQYLIKNYFYDHAEHAALNWLKDQCGGKDSWSNVVFGVVNENVQKNSSAEVSLSGPLHVHDTLNSLESGDPYELKAYEARVRAYRFNKVNFTFSTPEEVEDPVVTGLNHPGSKIWNFTYNGVVSPGGWAPMKDGDHKLYYVWDLSAGPYYNWVYHCVSCLMHDENGNPYWDFGYTVWVDPEHLDGGGSVTITQDYVANVELFGIEYFETGSSSFFSNVASVDVEYRDDRLTQLLPVNISIQNQGFYLVNISSQERTVFIPIFAYPAELIPPLVQVQIPDLPDRDEEVMVVVPKNSPAVDVNILKEEDWTNTSHFGVTPIVIPELDGFLGNLNNSTIIIDLDVYDVFESTDKIVISYQPSGDFTIKFLPDPYWHPVPYLHNYTVFTCNTPNPPGAYTPLVTRTSDGLKFLVACDWQEMLWVDVPELGIDNGTLVQFRLRQDVMWHDGKPLTAYDCAYALNLMATYRLEDYGSLSRDFVYAEAEEPYLLSVYFCDVRISWPFYRYFVASTATRFPEHIWSLAEDPEDFDPASKGYKEWTGNDPPGMYPLMTALVGNGPFVYRNYSVAYLPYEDYFIDKSGIAGVVDADYRIDPGTEATYNVIVQNDYPIYNFSDELLSNTLQVNVYEDDILVYTESVILNISESETLGPYTTSTLNAGDHTIKVEVIENGTTVHTYTHTLKVTIIEDINYDCKVDMRDISRAARAFGSYPGHLRWDPPSDINDDFSVNMRDISKIARKFGWEA